MGMDIRIRDEEDVTKEEEKKERKMGLTDSGESDMIRQETFLDIEMEKRRWQNRRRMAWTSLVAMNIITLLLLFAPISPDRLKIIAEPLIWSYFAFTSVIGAYMGFTTWANRK